MCIQLENLLALHCAPTLAGIKVGNMFTCLKKDIPDVQKHIAQYNSLWNAQDIHLEILAQRTSSWVIYVYRKEALQNILECPQVQQFLHDQGYPMADVEVLLKHLKKRMQRQDFPHEIGVFLDYPLADVQGFIAHHGEHYIAMGDWKVYHDKEHAQQRFAAFHKCSQVFTSFLQRGYTLAEVLCQ